MNSTTKVWVGLADAAPTAEADFTKIPTGTALAVADARSSTVAEHIGEQFAKAAVHGRTVSIAMTLQPSAADGVTAMLKAAYESTDPVFLGIKGSVAHSGVWELLVSDFPANLNPASVEEISLTLLHTGKAPTTFPTT